MNTKISGVPNWESKETRKQQLMARISYKKSIETLKAKKSEVHLIKQENMIEREKIRVEMKEAE